MGRRLENEYIFMLMDKLPYDIKLKIVLEALKPVCFVCKRYSAVFLVCDYCIVRGDPVYGHLYI